MSEEELVGAGIEGGLDPSAVIPAILQACPSLAEPWREHLSFWGNDVRGVYNDASVVAGHLVDLLVEGNRGELLAAFAAIEQLLVAGDRDTRAMLTVGVIEDTQNISLNRGRDPAQFSPFLGPETAAAWVRAHRYWELMGATSLADVIRLQRGASPVAGPGVDPETVSDPALRRIVESLLRPARPTTAGKTGAVRRLLARIHLPSRFPS